MGIRRAQTVRPTAGSAHFTTGRSRRAAYAAAVTRRIDVVPHTHWDREWYAPFPVFRQKLVDLLDELLPRLDAAADGAHFLLDGQLAVLDDYLELRPHEAERLARLGRAGRIGVGPWYVLMDEFLVSGETIIRDLQLGLRRAEDFGGAMRVGYLPDMFGHVAQMPQILRLARIGHAVVWRGVPAAVARTSFWWAAPDGSRVHATYLPQGYGNGAFLPDDPAFLLGRVREFLAAHGALVGDDDVLWMNGTDHQLPAPWLDRVLAAANAAQHELVFAVGSLSDHVARAPRHDLTTWTGELRSGARANLLMGVASNRVDVKQAAAAAERALERVAEPMCALLTAPDAWPQTALDVAWREVIRNSAHDSVCACSHDDVVAAVLHRYAEARHTADVLTERASYLFGCELADAGVAVVNPVSVPRVALVEHEIDGTVVGPEEQAVGHIPAHEVLHRVANRAAAVVVERELEIRTEVGHVTIDHAPEGALTVTLHETLPRGTRHLHGAVVVDLATRAAARPDATCTVVVARAPRTRVVRAVEVAPFGWAVVPRASGVDAPAVVVHTEVADTGQDDGIHVTNGLVRVRVDPATGTFSLDGHAGLGRLVDDGDAGDTYNWSPPDHGLVVDAPTEVAVDVLASGPVVGRVSIRATYELPARVVDDRRVGQVRQDITTVVEVRRGEPLVRVEVEIDNQARDHRLRAWFPLPTAASVSHAECAFTVVERGTTAEGGPSELPLPTFPSRRFVQAGDLTVVHDGLLEYELVDLDATGRAHALALTLLRCTGMLSRGPMRTRPLPAGPELALEGPQLRGVQRFRYALAVGATDPYALADAFTPFPTVDAPGGGTWPATGTALEVTGGVVSAVLRDRTDPELLVLRVHNPRPHPTRLQVRGLVGHVVDLLDEPVAPCEEHLLLQPAQIVTIRGALTSSRRPRPLHHHR